MRLLSAILFSLLLIAAQSLVVAMPVSGGPCLPEASCCGCGNACDCHVDRDTSAVPPVESAVVASPSSPQVAWVPVACLPCQRAPAEVSFLVPKADTLLSAASQPLFRLNCALLI